MSTISGQRKTVLQIVNEVQNKMAYSPTATLSANRTSILYLNFLNDVIAQCADYGDAWPQFYQEVTVTAAACANTYEINTSAPIKKIYEIHFQDQITPLWPRSVSQIRLLNRTSATGIPRQWALVNTSGINPIIWTYPTPSSNEAGKLFNVATYVMPATYTSSEANVIPPFSSRTLVAGVYAHALLDENGGTPTPQYQAQFQEYTLMLREEFNRYTADVGNDVYMRIVE